MTQPLDAPLPPPPRKAQIRRGMRNVRRGYSTMFALVILVFAGWVVLDVLRWDGLTDHQRSLTIGFALGALLAFVIWFFVDNPLRRELRLARRGETVLGNIVSLGKGRGRRPVVIVVYRFRTSAGAEVPGECRLPRRFPAETLVVGAEIEILYDPKNQANNKPRLGLEYVDV